MTGRSRSEQQYTLPEQAVGIIKCYVATVKTYISCIIPMRVQTFRADYIDWCLPLFGSTQPNPGSAKSNYYTCTFLATEGNMFFVNHTANSWEEDDCCLFQKVRVPIRAV